MQSVNAKSSSEIPDLSQRSCGVLLHVTSLPGKFGVGDMGPAAHQWINMLASAGQRWWQMLPLGPIGEGNSPYRSYSAFAGNPLLISPELLVQDGLLSPADLGRHYLPDGKVQFAKVARNKMALLQIAYERFCPRSTPKLISPFLKFISSQAGWLEDYALFTALRQAHPGMSWTQWPTEILRRKPAALRAATAELAPAIDFGKFIQFIFFRQLKSLRDHARKAGVELIGDLPIFVSPESADVWTHRQLFQLDRNLKPTAVAGVPPDLFSSTGQCWGNPLYNWKEMAKDQFAWWKARLQSALSQADLVRIDHFRGFESYWKIPASAPTAQTGKWVRAPGAELFQALIGDKSKLPVVAEDLGIITPAVEKLRDQFNLPGMRVLQFGFSGQPGDPHTPHNFIQHCFAYTGTHDNDTSVGWYRSLPAAAKQRLEKYAPHLQWKTDPAWSLIRLLCASTAVHAIIPLQDLLSLNSRARMNTPGESNGNWEWRLGSFGSCKKTLVRLAELTRIYGRFASRSA